MREFNFAIVLTALLTNTIVTIVAVATEMIATLDVFLLVWFVPSIVTLVWAGALYHKSSD